MVILAVDYGYVRTGLAVCDKSEFLASPVGTIKETYMPKVALHINEESKRLKAELVVVGLPKNMDGSEGEHAQKSRELKEILEKEYDLKVELWDERLTTVSAYRQLDESGTYGSKKRKKVVDQIAAVIILEDYMKSRKMQNQES